MSTPAHIEPSRVLYLENLAPKATDTDIEQFLEHYGDVDKIIILRKKHIHNTPDNTSESKNTQNALVQMANLDDAIAAHDAANAEPALLLGLPVTISYSKNQELRQGNNSTSPPVKQSKRAPREHGNQVQNRILLVTVQNPMYPITTDLIGKVFNVYGQVEKVVIFMKPVGLQCLVQFAQQQDAVTAKSKLDGEAIYPDCCFMVISYSNLSELAVNENSLKTRDFTNPNLPVPVMDTAINAPQSTIALPFNPPNGEEGIAGSQKLHGAGDGHDPFSPVLLVCNLKDTATCDKLFNLFSCYGNITRVKKLHSKPDHALVQFANETSAGSALTHLRGFVFEGRSLEIRFSKHRYIAGPRGGAPSEADDVDDNATAKEYSIAVNRFTGKYANYTKHIYSPTKVLHISNLTEGFDEAELTEHLRAFGRMDRVKLRAFENAKGHPQLLAEFPSIESATNMLAGAHNSEFMSKKLKIAFSRNTSHSN
ncbi:unnamed protein product [Aphanomyces euteiches]|uniref:RRM domain-containing protein n=1 Tax=Aphanomyces euteiches TaxID=100861 RepID=A0A6G0XF67_9STRA|nr:hypothetical protein Ae201684_005483 [Aphanomyces euteiches]KAH9093209.1 hypothetical protein Ae201684P_008868 [Aphanomyces euteiches]KAH9139866.1 hypothetical protein AeRB84_015889 [Aphanomyces euteiches]